MVRRTGMKKGGDAIINSHEGDDDAYEDYDEATITLILVIIMILGKNFRKIKMVIGVMSSGS